MPTFTRHSRRAGRSIFRSSRRWPTGWRWAALAICRSRSPAPLVDRVVTVSEEQISLAILRLAELEKSVVEGAAAAALAACMNGQLPELAGKRVVLLLTGGNIDPGVLGRVIEHGLVADGRLCRFTATISDRPGGLAKLAERIAAAGASIKEITHDRAFCGPGRDRSQRSLHRRNGRSGAYRRTLFSASRRGHPNRTCFAAEPRLAMTAVACTSG